MADALAWVPPNVDLTTPSAARAYDALLGGAHNFEVDRAFARKAEKVFPGVAVSCQANRAFLRRVVQFLMRNGVRQFLDIGSGIPTVGNVHEVAQAIDPACRVAYVDNEAVAVAHSDLILQDNDNATIVQADVREPESILEAPEVRRLLDFDQPVAVLMLALLHFVPDSDDPAALVAPYRDALIPGSYLAITHATGDSRPTEMRALEKLYATSSNPAVARTTQWITGLFGDWELVEPGAAYVPEWQPDNHVDLPSHPEHYIFFGGLARKPTLPAVS
ncbi:SAM-dependent methyltransferase [Kutzneria sp. CA-103260]|uniref:SAM-dependent methyltransferase n=1 Tax=Kutzneria sp. CA-103260 TaxID=2802641 RepID=UPI001BA70A15|nr:SAM-dependent methyltransferase [Kutzneria sp. CA-103260]QUQ67148.1 SAM-dependent methyltransferase [Kutzneria sp. CA-103260]